LLLCLSRSAWLGLLSGGFYVGILSTAGRRLIVGRTLLAGMAITLMLAVLLPAEWDALSVRLQPTSNQLEQNSITDRLSLLELSFKVISRHPLTGVGGNNFALAAGRFLPSRAGVQASSLPVHNTYLLAQAELGPLGAGSWLILMLTPLLGLARGQWMRRPTARLLSTTAARTLRVKQAIGSTAVTRYWCGSVGCSGTSRRSGPRQAQVSGRLRADIPLRTTPFRRWRALAGCSLVVVAVVGMFDFYIWVNEPVAVLWIVALALFTAS
jgi:O-antigen ligase/polysaccharide polymerase Wzy-like membrane protein